MGFYSMVWATAQKVKPLQKLVLVMLANRASDKDWICWPSVDTLADDCGMSKSGVRSQLSELVEIKLIDMIPRSIDGVCLSNHYRLNIPIGFRERIEGMARAPLVRLTEGGSPPDGSPLVRLTEGGSPPDGPEPIKEPVTLKQQKETREAKASSSPAAKGKPSGGSQSIPEADLPEWLPKDTWADFLAFRKRIKKPTDGTSEKLLIAKIGRLSGASDAIARKIMEESIANGWQGVFALKESKEEVAAGLTSTQPQQAQARKLNLAELRSKTND